MDATKSQGADFRAPRVGRGLAVGDYDNDGWQDFLVSNNGEDAQLFHNEGGVAVSSGPSFDSQKGGRSGGVMDLRKGKDKVDSGAPSSDSRMGGPSDVDAADRGVPGAANPRQSPSSRQGTVSTVPHDAASSGASAPEGSHSARRTDESAPQKNHWLAIRLIGTKSNRDGIGAHLKLVAGDLTSYDQSKGGMSYCSAQDPRIFFGLGSHARVDSLEIWWSSGLRESVTNLPVDVFLTIEEGTGKALARRYAPRKK